MFDYAAGVALQDVLTRVGPGADLWIIGGTLIDGTGAPARENASLHIEDGRIASVEIDMPSVTDDGGEMIDARGCWLMPGLIDCHVHLNGPQTMDAYRRYLTPSPEVKLFNSLRYATATLAAGFTTVRDVGSGNAVPLRKASEQNLIAAPRILAATNSLTVTGGHGDWTIFPLEFVRTMKFRGNIVDGVDECRRAVRLAFREGADLIKVIASGGGITNHPDDLAAHVEFSLEELSAIVEETHRRGARVAAHALGTEGATLAIQAGVDTIEHGVFEPDESLLNQMAEGGISLVPTLLIFDWTITKGREGGVFEGGIEAAKKLLEVQFRLIDAANRAGVNIAVGTDNSGVLGLGVNAREVELLHDAGLTASEALTAATRNSAIACGIAHDVGTIEPGKLADVLILENDPIDDLSSLCEAGSIRHIVQAAA